MGRRSIHTAEELRELILKAATELIESDGLAGLSAREVARRIGYSPGTLYNVFDNLDDLVLTIEARLLDRLAARLAEVPSASSPQEQLQPPFAIRQVHEQAAVLSTRIAEKILRRNLNPDDQRELVRESLEQLQTVKA